MNRIFMEVSVSSVPVWVAAGARPYTCPAMAKQSGEKLIVDNRRARHDYHLSDRVEAGVVLMGTEVKSLRGGEATLQQAYAEVRDGEAWLVGLHVPEYTEGNRANHDPDRPRKLLLHRRGKATGPPRGARGGGPRPPPPR